MLVRGPFRVGKNPLAGEKALWTVLAGTVATVWALGAMTGPIDQSPCDACNAAANVAITPLGFTNSLWVYFGPLLLGVCWAWLDRDLAPWRTVLLRSLLLIWLLSIIIDLGFLGGTCFTFPNKDAVLDIPWLRAFNWYDMKVVRIPWEDLLFYLGAAGMTLVVYAFLTLSYLKTTNEDYIPDFSARELARFVRGGEVVPCFHSRHLSAEPKPPGLARSMLVYLRTALSAPEGVWAGSILWIVAGLMLFIGLVDSRPGVPLYFVYLLVGAGSASFLLLGPTLDHVNWRAFAMTALYMTMLSIAVEITMALPFGWWGFNDAVMIGTENAPWYHHPIEQVFLYVVSTYEIVLLYEAVLLWEAWAHPQPLPTRVEIEAR